MATHTCRTCKKELDKESFFPSSVKKHDWQCRKCQTEKSSKFQKVNREKVNENHRKYAFLNPEKTRGYQKKHRNLHHEELLIREKAKRMAIRMETISFYSLNTMMCVCCAEANIEFLCIDHINNDGAIERKELKMRHISTGSKFYSYLKSKGFPPGYRVLCNNCNMSRGSYGYCPHEQI